MIKNFFKFSCFVTLFTVVASSVTYADGEKFPDPKELGIANNPNKPAGSPAQTNEPTIAVNPTNSRNIVISANDFTNLSGLNLNGVYTSFDKGETWSQQIIDWSSTGYQAQADNSIAFGPKPTSKGFSYNHGARAYLCADAFLNDFSTQAEVVSFAYSDDGGLNFKGLQIIGPADATVENDNPGLTTDPWNHSPNFGNVYVSWTHQQFTDATQNTFASETIQVVTSTDGGHTFSAPVNISSSDTSNQRRWGAVPVTSPDGTLYVFWWETADISASGGFMNVINGNKSVDGGKTWLPEPFRVATLIHPPAQDFPFAPLPGTTLFTRPRPSAAADANNNVYVTLQNYDVSTGHGWISLARSTDSGLTWEEQVVANVPGRTPLFGSVSVNRFLDSTNVMVSFMAFDDVPAGTMPGPGVVLGDAYSVLSTDSGENFSSPPTKVSKQSSDPNSESGGGFEFMGDYTWVTDSPDGSFYYAWTDSRRGTPTSGRSDIFVARIKSTEKRPKPPVPLVGEIVGP